ncbi:ATP-binding protein, partial [Streptomyces sp900116325]|uniref:ATP-binding protein n=1 Tax=Streptomyces sp. 900116325 TaxID=3154295 RepID=UPI0033AED63B
GVPVSVPAAGPGVPAASAAPHFDPARRPPPPAGPAAAGLGLALARRLARAAGGDITLDTAAPGARFEVTLPAG